MNKLIVIGYMGIKRCYLNISEEEARRRYKVSDGESFENEDVPVQTFEFEDEFGAYDVYAID